MQAIILAAGMGKRLGELTQGNTKCMVKVGGETLIARLLRQLDKQNLSKIILVVGYKAKELKEYLTTISIKTPIEFVENSVYDQTNNIYSLYLAKDHLTSEDTLLFESDLIMEDAVITKLLQHPYPDLALVDKYESWMDGTVVTIDEENRIRMDDWELRDDVQEKAVANMNATTDENLSQYCDLAGYKHDFLTANGFGVEGVDYSKDVERFDVI